MPAEGREEEIALLQIQIRQQEMLFDESMNENIDFSKTKMIFSELQKMIERLEELKGMEL
jgi:hypothetical protein